MNGRTGCSCVFTTRQLFSQQRQWTPLVKIFTVPCVNLFLVSDIYFQTRIADKDLLFLRRLLGTRQAYKWGVVHFTEVQLVKGASKDLWATWRHIWANFAVLRHIWAKILPPGQYYIWSQFSLICQAAAVRLCCEKGSIWVRVKV